MGQFPKNPFIDEEVKSTKEIYETLSKLLNTNWNNRNSVIDVSVAALSIILAPLCTNGNAYDIGEEIGHSIAVNIDCYQRICKNKND